MTIRAAPKIRAEAPPDSAAFELTAEALDRWIPGIRAEQTPENTITMLEVIGEDFWTGGGVTAKRVSAALRQIDGQDVYVDINSPGGDFFEGITIYNMLRAHKGAVHVRVLGLAASAASIIAMAGDTVEVAKTGFLMIHNAWVVAVGNRHELADITEAMAKFDSAMVDAYVAKSGAKAGDIEDWMDAETWFTAKEAVEAGLADDYLAADLQDDPAQAAAHENINATRRVEHLLARAGMSRKESRSLLGRVKQGGTHDAAATATRDAGEWLAAAAQLTEKLKN